jgi:hypothetical protein
MAMLGQAGKQNTTATSDGFFDKNDCESQKSDCFLNAGSVSENIW